MDTTCNCQRAEPISNHVDGAFYDLPALQMHECDAMPRLTTIKKVLVHKDVWVMHDIITGGSGSIIDFCPYCGEKLE